MRTFLLVALVASASLVSLVPPAAAAPPEPSPWSPYQVHSEITAVALAAEAGTFAVATVGGTPTLPGQGQLPAPGATTPRTADLAIFRNDTGFVRNGTNAANSQTSSPSGAPALGRTHVAVSRTGTTVASLGHEIQSGVAGLRIHYVRAPPSLDWTSPLVVDTNQSLPWFAAGLLISADGTRVVAATNDSANFTVRGFSLAGNALVPSFSYTGIGQFQAFAGTGDLSTVWLTARVREGANLTGAVHRIPFLQGAPDQSYFDRRFANTTIAGLGVDENGTRLVAGTTQGTLYLFRPGTLTEPVAYKLPAENETFHRVLVSYDGARVAAVAARRIYNFAYDATSPRLAWNLTAPADIASLQFNRTGGILLAAYPTTQGGLVAYGEFDNRPIWEVRGNTTSGSIDAEGTYVAFSQRDIVRGERIRRVVNLEHAGGGENGPVRSAPQGGSATFELQVRNSGAGPERVRIQGPAELDLTVRAEPAEIFVRPQETVRFNLSVTPARLFGGNLVFNVTAVALTTNYTDDVVLNLTLAAVANVSLDYVGPREITVEPGVPQEILMGIRNTGTRDAAVGLRATQVATTSQPWSIVPTPASLVVAPGSVTTARVVVTAPARAENGSSSAATFLLEGEGIADEVRITFRISPSLGVDVTAAGRVKFIEPGKSALFNVSVTNTGSLPRRFEVVYDLAPGTERPWPVDLSNEPFRLDAGATRVVPVRVFAPGDTTPSDRLSILVTARSIPVDVNETIVHGNVTLFANGATPIVTVTPGEEEGKGLIPAPGATLLLGALALLSLALRRRRGA